MRKVQTFDIIDVWWIKDQNRVAIVGDVQHFSFTCMCVTTGEIKKLKHDKVIGIRDTKLVSVIKL